MNPHVGVGGEALAWHSILKKLGVTVSLVWASCLHATQARVQEVPSMAQEAGSLKPIQAFGGVAGGTRLLPQSGCCRSGSVSALLRMTNVL